MTVIFWILAGGVLLVAAVLLASLIDRRAGWSQVPLDLDGSPDLDRPVVNHRSRA